MKKFKVLFHLYNNILYGVYIFHKIMYIVSPFFIDENNSGVMKIVLGLVGKILSPVTHNTKQQL